MVNSYYNYNPDLTLQEDMLNVPDDDEDDTKQNGKDEKEEEYFYPKYY